MTSCLQFGHGGEAVEMGSAAGWTRPTRPLQFGHGGEAVEMIVRRPPQGKVRVYLQFGHGGEAVEIAVPVPLQ